MNILRWILLSSVLCFQLSSFGQKLKKSDRQIVTNFRNHMKILGVDSLAKDSFARQQAAAEYISRQFSRAGLKPLGDTNSYLQEFAINEGKEVLPATFLSLNGEKLELHKDYFPFTFSASKNAEAAVAIALAESGVPWFKDLKELLQQEDDSKVVDTLELIRKKAALAAEKGASALIVYNTGNEDDLKYDKLNKSAGVAIPVIYLAKEAFKHYSSDESEIIDISLNVALQDKKRRGLNVVGMQDNNADSTIVTAAKLEHGTNVAALLEVARMMKASKPKRNNYVFIAYCSEGGEENEVRNNSSVKASNVKKEILLDTVTVSNNKPEGLYLVKQSVDLIKKQ